MNEMTTPLRPRTAADAMRHVGCFGLHLDKDGILRCFARAHSGDDVFVADLTAEAAPDLRAALKLAAEADEALRNDWALPLDWHDRYEQARAALAAPAAENDYDATILQGYAGPLDTQGAPAVPVQPDDLAADREGEADGLDVRTMAQAVIDNIAFDEDGSGPNDLCRYCMQYTALHAPDCVTRVARRYLRELSREPGEEG